MAHAIRPCCYPGCRDSNGDPRLTGDVICGPSRFHYRQLLDRLAVDYVILHTTMPKPVSTGPVTRTSTTKTYGHPAEWASDTLRDIADKLNTVEDNLREVLGHAPAVHPGHREHRRVALAHHYLTAWFDELCVFDGAEDVAIELNDLHRKIQSALGKTRRTTHLPVPCPRCDLMTMFRTTGAGRDDVDCRACGTVFTGNEYSAYTRVLVDEVLDTPGENSSCA